MHATGKSDLARSIKVALVAGLVLCHLVLSVVPGYATTTNVSIQALAFSPQHTTITSGQTVNWTNNDPVSHTLWFINSTDGSTFLLSPPISPGSTWAHAFTSVGNLNYYDFDRLWINATITVLPTVTLGGHIVAKDEGVLSNLTTLIIILALSTTALAVVARSRNERLVELYDG